MIRVELRAAKIPGLPGLIADHYWLLIHHPNNHQHHASCDRWEVWQHSNQNHSCWGHLHKNLLPPKQGVGNGPSRLIHTWTAVDALRLATRIETSPTQYPYIEKYRYWPGPNSNTYAQWIVRDQLLLGKRAIGREFKVLLGTHQ